MLLLPNDLAHQFSAFLDRKGISIPHKVDYLKWLRVYWDFCHQYHYNAYCTESLPPFLDKLREQRQSDSQWNQARQAIAWLHHLQPISTVTSDVLAPSKNLAAVRLNPDGALSSVVVPSNTIVENATTSTAARSQVLVQHGSKKPSQPDSYNQ
jgi:hypothetical protein